jgi:hypothetical protein
MKFLLEYRNTIELDLIKDLFITSYKITINELKKIVNTQASTEKFLTEPTESDESVGSAEYGPKKQIIMSIFHLDDLEYFSVTCSNDTEFQKEIIDLFEKKFIDDVKIIDKYKDDCFMFLQVNKEDISALFSNKSFLYNVLTFLLENCNIIEFNLIKDVYITSYQITINELKKNI